MKERIEMATTNIVADKREPEILTGILIEHQPDADLPFIVNAWQMPAAQGEGSWVPLAGFVDRGEALTHLFTIATHWYGD